MPSSESESKKSDCERVSRDNWSPTHSDAAAVWGVDGLSWRKRWWEKLMSNNWNKLYSNLSEKQSSSNPSYRRRSTTLRRHSQHAFDKWCNTWREGAHGKHRLGQHHSLEFARVF